MCMVSVLLGGWYNSKLVVPVSNKRCVGMCTSDMFKGIALTSVVYKVFCMIFDNRLSDIQ